LRDVAGEEQRSTQDVGGGLSCPARQDPG
jgi:hypothetical protein